MDLKIRQENVGHFVSASLCLQQCYLTRFLLGKPSSHRDSHVKIIGFQQRVKCKFFHITNALVHLVTCNYIHWNKIAKKSTEAMFFTAHHFIKHYTFSSTNVVNSLWPRDTIWRHGSRSTLVQVMACCLTAPSYYLNQCWLIFSKVLWHSPQGNFIRNAQ